MTADSFVELKPEFISPSLTGDLDSSSGGAQLLRNSPQESVSDFEPMKPAWYRLRHDAAQVLEQARNGAVWPAIKIEIEQTDYESVFAEVKRLYWDSGRLDHPSQLALPFLAALVESLSFRLLVQVWSAATPEAAASLDQVAEELHKLAQASLAEWSTSL